jgi:hypothetical protein
MRKIRLAGLALLVMLELSLFALFVYFNAPSPTPVPEVGMTMDEVIRGPIGKGTDHELKYSPGVNTDCLCYYTPDDDLGRSEMVFVQFKDGKVTYWIVVPRKPGWRVWFWDLKCKVRRLLGL